MRKILFLTVLLCGLALMIGCDLSAPVRKEPVETTDEQKEPITLPETAEVTTAPETEPPSLPETPYFPNDPDDDHTKRY